MGESYQRYVTSQKVLWNIFGTTGMTENEESLRLSAAFATS